MNTVVLLDSGPVGLSTHTKATPLPLACRDWLADLVAAGRRVILPEISDYEVRRELLRLRLGRSVARLDSSARQLEYLPITTAAMRLAAELWANARQAGRPTAGDKTIDADMILAGQALTLGASAVIVATTNIGHLAQVVPAETWQNIVP